MALATENTMIETTAIPLKIHLIRHGETEWSLSGQHTSRTDIALTEQGEHQARELGQRLSAIDFTRIFASPRKRAQQTHALSGVTPASEIDPDLAEWDYGDYEGQRTVDIRTTRPDWNLFRDGCPNGESPTQICERVNRLIGRLGTLAGDVAVFTHGHLGSVLVARWIGLPIISAENLPLTTASHSVLGFKGNDSAVPIITLFNSS